MLLQNAKLKLLFKILVYRLVLFNPDAPANINLSVTFKTMLRYRMRLLNRRKVY